MRAAAHSTRALVAGNSAMDSATCQAGGGATGEVRRAAGEHPEARPDVSEEA